MRVVDQATGEDITDKVGAKPGRGGDRERPGPTRAGDRPRAAEQRRPTRDRPAGMTAPGATADESCAGHAMTRSDTASPDERVAGAEGTAAMKAINAIRMGGVDVLPLVEGGKGVSDLQRHLLRQLGRGRRRRHVQRGQRRQLRRRTAGAIPQVYHGRTRRERHEELVAYAVRGALTQARQAYEIAGGKGRIHANILWEMGARRAHHHRGAGAGEGAHQRHHLRRRDALSPVRHRRAVQRPLLPDHLLGARVQRAVEARLLQGRRAARRRGLRRPVAGRRP